jgi:hypothetical protein
MKDFHYPVETVSGERALERLAELRALGQGTPVILGDADDFENMVEVLAHADQRVEDLLAQAAGINALDWLQEREDEDPEGYEAEEGEWPEEDCATTELISHRDILTGQPLEKVHITVLPTNEAWQAACYLNTGGWNDVPFAHENSALWRYWEQRYGAKVACIAGDVVEFTVERPPRTQAEAMTLARQHFVYCRDIVHQGTNTIETLAATLLKAPVWFFWWD